MKQKEFMKEYSKKYKPRKLKEKTLPTHELKIIGISGSRGKSTTAYLIAEYLKSLNKKVTLYSSIEIYSPNSYKTLYEAVENPLRNEEMLYNALVEANANDSEYLILEVNEKAIKNKVIDELDFDVCLLTNIIEKQNEEYDDYIEIKKDFLRKRNQDCKLILSVVDPLTYSLYNELPKDNLFITSTEYFTEKYFDNNKNTINYLLLPYKDNPLDTMKGLEFNILINNKDINYINTEMLFPYNAINILNVISVLDVINEYDEKEFKKFIKKIDIPGRDEIIKYQNKTIIVSTNLSPHLEHLNRYKKNNEINNIIVVTGSTGSGYITWNQSEKYQEVHKYDIEFAYEYINKYADKVYITETDIGDLDKKEFFEYQKSKVKDIVAIIVYNRHEAIKLAINESNNKDVIFISGRGNRRLMCVGKRDVKIFKDKDHVETIIRGE